MKNLLAFSFFLFFVLKGSAQITGNQTATHPVVIELNSVLSLELERNDLVSFVFSDLNDYENGVEQLDACEFVIRGNLDWSISWKAETAFFISAGPTQVPASVVSVGNNITGYLPLSAQNQNSIISGVKGDENISGNRFSLNYRANPGYDYDPGLYNIDITYTLSPQ